MREFPRETRARTPIRGLRTKLRIALKQSGINDKFRTDHLRNNTLVVISKNDIKLPFTEFEGYVVKVIKSTD